MGSSWWYHLKTWEWIPTCRYTSDPRWPPFGHKAFGFGAEHHGLFWWHLLPSEDWLLVVCGVALMNSCMNNEKIKILDASISSPSCPSCHQEYLTCSSTSFALNPGCAHVQGISLRASILLNILPNQLQNSTLILNKIHWVILINLLNCWQPQNRHCQAN